MIRIDFHQPGLLAALALLCTFSFLAGQALAGTEDGSFCPTCPDWTNPDAWLKQKQAYEQANSPLVGNGDSSATSTPQQQPAVEERPKYARDGYLTASGTDLVGWTILDARSPEDYVQGHITGARNLYWKSVTSGETETLNATLMVQRLGALGIGSDDNLLVYGNGDDASYLFWSLDYLGHQNLSRLDGGVKGYLAAGEELVQNSPTAMATVYQPRLQTWRRAEPSELNSPTVQIVDARSSFADYGRARIKGAIQIKSESLFADPEVPLGLLGAAELESRLAGRGLDRERLQVVYGMPAASTVYYVLRLMDYNATLVDGDWWESSVLVEKSIS